jgi:pimeloyl-ACP methyl ester carboxylesterase
MQTKNDIIKIARSFDLKENLLFPSMEKFWNIYPSLFSNLMKETFFAPPAFPLKETHLNLKEAARSSYMKLDHKDGYVKLYRWGHGKKIILVHGWGGSAVQMTSLIENLSQNGFEVISFDHVGHGESSGRGVTLFDYIETLNTLIYQEENIEGLIGHSMGCAAVLKALDLHPWIEHSVLIAPQYDFVENLRDFFSTFKIPERLGKKIIESLENTYQLKLSESNPKDLAPELENKILIVHDEKDAPVPLQNGEKLHQALRNSQLVKTQGLGHFRILRDKKVAEEIGAWLSNVG